MKKFLLLLALVSSVAAAQEQEAAGKGAVGKEQKTARSPFVIQLDAYALADMVKEYYHNPDEPDSEAEWGLTAAPFVNGFGVSFTSFSDSGKNGVQVFYEQSFEKGLAKIKTNENGDPIDEDGDPTEDLVADGDPPDLTIMRFGIAYVRRLNPLRQVEVSFLIGGGPFFILGEEEQEVTGVESSGKRGFGLSVFGGLDFVFSLRKSNAYLALKNRLSIDIDRAVGKPKDIQNRLRYTPALGFGLHY